MFILLPAFSIVGAYFSKQLKLGQNRYFYIIPFWSLLSGVMWAVISKFTRMPLSIASVVFDIIYGLFYFFAFVYFGEKVTMVQGIGVIVALIGLVLISL